MKMFKPDKASAVLIGIIIVVIFGLVGWGTYILIKSSTQELPEGEEFIEEQEPLSEEEDEFVDWKIYRNEKYGFEVKYPEDWNHIIVSENWIAFDRLDKTHPGPDAPTYDFNIKVDKVAISDLNQWAIQEAGGQEVITSSEDITIDEVSAKRIEYFGFYPWYLAAGAMKNGNLYEFFTVNKDVVSTFNQILSTFKFLEPDETNVFRFEDIKVGDKVAEMTVVSIEKASDRVRPNPPDLPLSETNVVVVFSGEVTITGKYFYGLGNIPCFSYLDESSQKKIPVIQRTEEGGGKTGTGFCFSNDDLARELLGPDTKKSEEDRTIGEATIVINEFNLVSYPAGLSNPATLIRVLDKKF